MKQMRITDILSYLDEKELPYHFLGDKDVTIEGFSSLSEYRKGNITWIKQQKDYEAFKARRDITCAIAPEGMKVDVSNAIFSENPKEVFFSILHHFWGKKFTEGTIGEGTVISEEAIIDPTATIGCNCSLIGEVVIGAHSVIEHNVVLQGRVQIGKRCHIQSGAVIGIAGFGYSQDPVQKKKTMVEHFGGVRIEDDVFIGSHVNIARGTIDDTLISSGVKIAPSTHIGHNDQIGEDAAIICSTLYGSVKVGTRAYITDSTVQNQLSVGKDTVIGMGSVVHNPIESGVIAYGIPAVARKKNDSGL